MTQATPTRGKLVFVVATGKVDYHLGCANAESALGCGDVEDAVESTGSCAVKSDANALEDDLAVMWPEWKSDPAGKSKIKEGQAPEKLFRRRRPVL